jgi:hypothetical protein
VSIRIVGIQFMVGRAHVQLASSYLRMRGIRARVIYTYCGFSPLLVAFALVGCLIVLSACSESDTRRTVANTPSSAGQDQGAQLPPPPLMPPIGAHSSEDPPPPPACPPSCENALPPGRGNSPPGSRRLLPPEPWILIEESMGRVFAPGSRIHMDVLTRPGADCSMEYLAPTGGAFENPDVGTARPRGLEPKKASVSGWVSWTWTIDARSPSGYASLTVICEGHGQSTRNLEIGG